MSSIFTTSLDPVYQGVFQMFAGGVYDFSGGVITNLNTDAAYDFTGHTCECNIREKDENGEIVEALTTTDSSIILEDGQIKVPQLIIENAGDYLADFVVTLPDMQEMVFLRARFIVKPRT